MTPYWPNVCNHPGGSYIGSFEWLHSPKDINKYDLYIFGDINGNQQVCLRYGEDDPEYESPGTLISFLRSMHTDPMKGRALDLMLKEGKIKFQRIK